MDLISAYQALNRSTLELLKSVNVLTPHVEEEEENITQPIRLKEKKFVLTDNIKRHSKAVTAHDLSQYRNVFNTIKLQDAIETWLDFLLEIDKEGTTYASKSN